MDAPANKLEDSTSQVKKKTTSTKLVVDFQIQLNKSFYIECVLQTKVKKPIALQKFHYNESPD